MQNTTELTFEQLGLHPKTLKTLAQNGYETPSPIQAELIPLALTGRDCIGQARTGTGKTAAFMLPTMERIDLAEPAVQVLALAPTRELSEQVMMEAKKLCGGRIKLGIGVGGRPIHLQIRDIENGAQGIIGTPGRIIDLLRRGALNLDKLKVLILDEADRMLDIGFRPDIERIIKQCPKKRQTLLLSATLPPPVEKLAQKYMTDPEMVDLSEDNVVVDTIEQYYVTVDENRKRSLLLRVLAQEKPAQAIVFTRTKRGADKLLEVFSRRLKSDRIAAIHGDLPQRKRDRVIKDLRAGKLRLLIATDVVGRGIDISGISHIINYDIPEFCDDYVHRVGRTGRLSSAENGRAITFVRLDQGGELTNIEMRINTVLPEYRVDGFEAYAPKERSQRTVRKFGA
ncbi:DEAD/DEAH box helicase [Fuerstiella marisgermanici]|uniref:DEAD-box ATP-dependent RNA helicase CshA n=1 Tax=Fuerstiella marisgermanici TaxID=1891926 RepID=A0A1P8WFI7_9PLAN|nr:DEAD/DEAH box helicase [Fuerstiella marisgermanici]APZ92835.1 DEAD-box ATP-dependent RNA helicase CshA [Fuerstiella marisgermanici]